MEFAAARILPSGEKHKRVTPFDGLFGERHKSHLWPVSASQREITAEPSGLSQLTATTRPFGETARQPISRPGCGAGPQRDSASNFREPTSHSLTVRRAPRPGAGTRRRPPAEK